MTTVFESRGATMFAGPYSEAGVSRESVLSFLLLAYVALLPFQIPVNNRLNVAPADIFLALILVLTPGSLKFRKHAWTIWHFGLLLVFGIGGFLTAGLLLALTGSPLLTRPRTLS